MESNSVFSSNITRAAHKSHQNNLYDLLNIIPAKPLELNDVKKYTCNYTPKTDKYYISKRKSRLKVKTVRDIRKSFEQDIYTHLFTGLETQHNILFKKIRFGSSGDDNTKKLAKKILNGDMPISRSTWQMLINLNPEHNERPRQFVLWNSRFIQVTGSRGGANKLICNYDLANKKLPSQYNKINQTNSKLKLSNKKKGILRNSLVVKFKPGPLSKKQILDYSYQKHHVGKVELVDIPKPGLDVQPTYGTTLEPTIVHFLNSLRKEDGTISQKWAEFAVSALGKVEKSNAIQLSRDCVTFELFYNYNQNRLLMRRDTDNHFSIPNVIRPVIQIPHKNTETANLSVQEEVEDIIDKIISAVEINILQDKLFTEEHELRQISSEDSTLVDNITHNKDKSKRKFGELDRLDVTVIRLPETEESFLQRSCGKLHCSFGCICASLEGTDNYRQHCGRIECMLDCTCDFSENKYDLSHSSCPEVIPKFLNLNDKMNLKLAKEEQKFHQTVIVTGKRRILLKGEKRNWNTSKKYAGFYNNISLEKENQKKQDFSIVAFKLNCNNIEPWCMVHKLYKCFCKGKFTETCATVSNDTLVKEPAHKDTCTNIEDLETNYTIQDTSSDNKMECVQSRSKFEALNSLKRSKTLLDSKPDKIRHTSRSSDECMNSCNSLEFSDSDSETVKNTNEICDSSGSENVHKNMRNMRTRRSLRNNTIKGSETISDSEYSRCFDLLTDNGTSCARTSAYEGRKYSDGYYKNTNEKIYEMEKNDKRLQERLATLNKTTSTPNNSPGKSTIEKPTAISNNATTSLMELLRDYNDMPVSKNDDESTLNTKRRLLCSETKLVAWLESNYKKFKQRNDQGLFKNSLEPPKLGKVALHSWEFILNRYRERKNLFLVSQQKPYRIFMAVNTKSTFFENCININDIRFANLHKYPQTVKNLLINATDLKDNFCILRGLSCCWELIGSVTKVNESSQLGVEHVDLTKKNAESSLKDTFILNKSNDTSDDNSPVEQNTEQTHLDAEKESKSSDASPEDAGSSKWFVMTIEKDFSEIRFFRKGFFVKSDTIINAIHVARLSGKTVRLSSKKCIEQTEIPQFGIYAIPNNNEYCVFVGPYEMEDTLGIETIKTILDVRKLNRTRGFWITTNKVDNMKVVENPLSFVPISNARNNNAIPLETNFFANDTNQHDKSDTSVTNKIEESKECTPTKKTKIVKPIKIRKTNGFYHLASDGFLKKIPLPYNQNISHGSPMVLNACLNYLNDTKKSSEPNAAASKTISNHVPETLQDADCTSIPETVPQIKITAVFSQNDALVKNAKQEKGMFILKPEEINRKVFQSKLKSETCTPATGSNAEYDGAANANLESDYRTDSRSNISSEYGTLKDDVYILSDDEYDEINNESVNNYNIWKNVWIECTNISNLGWIAGIRNIDHLLSFKFPGCEYSEFYTKEEAFSKINSELLTRIDTSKNLKPEWKVTESFDELQGQEMNPEHLYPDYMLTQEGLLHTSDFIKSNKDNLKTYSKIQLKDKAPFSPNESAQVEIRDDEEKSRKIEKD